MHTSPATGHFILAAFCLVGALNVTVGLPLSVITLTLSGHATVGMVDTADRQRHRPPSSR
jgi:hypothetical protein